MVASARVSLLRGGGRAAARPRRVRIERGVRLGNVERGRGKQPGSFGIKFFDAGPDPEPPRRRVPSSGPVPARFAATSVTFVSADEAFVLGTAPCAHAPCTSVVRTLDRGQSWVGPARPGRARGPARAGQRRRWCGGSGSRRPGTVSCSATGCGRPPTAGPGGSRDAAPGGSILSLAIVDGQVLALTARCTPGGGCAQPAFLERRALGGGSWAAVEKVTIGNVIDPDDLIATQAGVAAVTAGRDVLVTGDGGLTFTSNPLPCPAAGPGSFGRGDLPARAGAAVHRPGLYRAHGQTGLREPRRRSPLGRGRNAEPGRRWRHDRGHHRPVTWPSPPRARPAGCSTPATAE